MALPFFLKMYITYFNPHSSPRESVSKYRSRPDKESSHLGKKPEGLDREAPPMNCVLRSLSK